jgi:hypothetical protein
MSVFFEIHGVSVAIAAVFESSNGGGEDGADGDLPAGGPVDALDAECRV